MHEIAAGSCDVSHMRVIVWCEGGGGLAVILPRKQKWFFLLLYFLQALARYTLTQPRTPGKSSNSCHSLFSLITGRLRKPPIYPILIYRMTVDRLSDSLSAICE